jgi:hypothetical protein
MECTGLPGESVVSMLRSVRFTAENNRIAPSIPRHDMTIAIGFRVKSGWAVAIPVELDGDEPRVLERCVVQLADPSLPESTQPYHGALGVHSAASKAQTRRLLTVVKRYSARSLDQLFDRLRGSGHVVVATSIVVGSVIDPAAIANEHIRAHAEEGRLFRTVIEDAARARAIRTAVIPEKELYARASKVLRMPEAQVRKTVAALGADGPRPWRAEEKTAAAAAWMSLAE